MSKSVLRDMAVWAGSVCGRRCHTTEQVPTNAQRKKRPRRVQDTQSQPKKTSFFSAVKVAWVLRCVRGMSHTSDTPRSSKSHFFWRCRSIQSGWTIGDDHPGFPQGRTRSALWSRTGVCRLHKHPRATLCQGIAYLGHVRPHHVLPAYQPW